MWTPDQEITAARLNGSPVAPPRFRSGGRITGSGMADGVHLHRVGRRPILALLAGAGPAYTFTQQIDADGQYVAGPRTGTAYEVGKITGLAGNVVRAYPDRFGSYRFQWVAASSGSSSGGGSTTLPTCFCITSNTLSMTSLTPSCNYGMYQSCTLQYGPPPPEIYALGLTDNGYYSTQSFVDSLSGAYFWYKFTCNYNVFSLSRYFPHYPDGTPGGKGFTDGTLYSWQITGTYNKCTYTNAPNSGIALQLTRGTAYAGSDGSCNVQISG